VFQELKQFTGVGTEYTKWFRVTDFHELLAFIKLAAQGTYDNEILNINVQIQTPDGDAVDLKDVKFPEIGDKTGNLPFLDYIAFTAFGPLIRFKIVTTGTSPDYTFKLTGIAKKRA